MRLRLNISNICGIGGGLAGLSAAAGTCGGYAVCANRAEGMAYHSRADPGVFAASTAIRGFAR